MSFNAKLLTAASATVVILLLFATSCSGDQFTVGYITGSQRRDGNLVYEKPGRMISGAINLAVEEVNDPETGTLGRRGHQLNFIVAETFGEEETSILETAKLWRHNVSGYIGPQETCFHEGRMATAFNLPMISYFCTDHSTSDKQLFPTFARTRPPDTQISKSVLSVLLEFNWTHVVFLYLNSSDNVFGRIAETILDTLESSHINIQLVRTWNTIYDHGYSENPFFRIVEDTYEDTRIYIILGYSDAHIGLLVAMERMKLFDKGEYFVVGINREQYNPVDAFSYIQGFLKWKAYPEEIKAFRSYLGIAPSPPIGFANFAAAVNSYMEKPPFNSPRELSMIGLSKGVRPEAAYLYDAVHLYAKAIIDVIDSGGNPYNGTAIINTIRGCRYSSAMGYMVYMDYNGDAEGNYTVLARRNSSLFPYKYLLKSDQPDYGLYPIGLFTLRSNKTQLPILHLTSEMDWVAGRPPVAVLPCGFRGEKCTSHAGEILAGVVGGAIAVLLIVALVFYRNWRYEQELDSLLWKIDYKEIEIHDENKQGSSNNGNNNGTTNTTTSSNGGTLQPANSSTNKNKSSHPFIRTSQVSLSSNPDADFRYSSIFTKIGIYRGRIYAIKKVHKKTIDITREMKKELKMMRDLRHNNLNAFIGACTDPPNICIITEYCTRGSLKDILENEEVKLDNMFVASIVADILRGMIYLHDSPVKFHGKLCSSNCLVDSRWVVKIGDFGLQQFKKGADESLKYADDPAQVLSKCESLLYRAPELLRPNTASAMLVAHQCPLHHHHQQQPPAGTQKGDVYSFSIILYELHSRQGPFGQTGLSAPEILQRVIYCPPGRTPFRPNLDSLENSFDFVRDCLKECWAEVPEQRPDFKTVRTKLRPLRKGMKPNIFDNMMAMMEKYANNLEVLVDERTDQLQEEKKKTEALLLEMLPRPVAEQLKRGNKVEAESFDCVTIYFSDIVGFTSMSAESTPLEVVDFLNDLYTCFDSIIENYDVYKVETIGDAYMVVSGLPIRNDDQHAAEIASMSLHLLSAVKKFTIRHRPSEKLMLRIGIHSGPVCAGVVGLKMPRYCLFGDTVNTSSRMESTGQPLKIHCSKECKDLLDKLGGYTIADRGYVEMKGKGEKLTYWLLGEDPEMRSRRTEERCARRTASTGKPCRNVHHSEVNGVPGIPRSSLKNKNILPKSPLPRCSSLESPKRLRFASGDRLEFYHHNYHQRCSKDPLLEVISDNSPIKKSSGSLIETSECCSEALRTSSSSCPCIENIANSCATLAQSQLSMFSRDIDNKICSSVPSLSCKLEVKNYPLVTISSAPTSPRRKDVTLDMVFNSHFNASDDNPSMADPSVPLLPSSLKGSPYSRSPVLDESRI